jgi:hypothetical protein
MLAAFGTALLPILVHANDWTAAESAVEIIVATTNKDGSERNTTIWIAVLDGEAFVRTSGTAWGRNVELNPNIVLRIADETYSARGERVLDAVQIACVQAKFREKYGFGDRLARFVRFMMGGARIYRVSRVSAGSHASRN